MSSIHPIRHHPDPYPKAISSLSPSRAFGLIAVVLSMAILSSCTWLKPLVPWATPAPQAREKAAGLEADKGQEAYRHFILASLAIHDGHFSEARKHLSRAISADPNSTYLRKKMAAVLKRLKDYPGALVHARKCLELDVKDHDCQTILADLYTLRGQDDHALKLYEEILVREPKNQRIRLLISTILIRQGRFAKATKHLSVLTRQSPNLVVAHYYQGRINLEMKQYLKAEKSFLRALQLNSRLEPALFDLGTLYQVTRRYAEAIDTYKTLLGFYPDNLSVRERLVDIYFKLGKKKQAEEQMKKIKSLAKPGESGRKTLGLIYLKHGRLDDSIKELEMIVAAWPKDDKSRYYLATAYEEKGKTDKALEHFRRIPSDSKYHINAQLHIAYLLDSKKKYDDAVSVLEKAIAMQRDKVELYLMLSSIYETQGKYDKAIEAVNKGLEQDQKNVNLIFRRGVLLDKKGDKQACIKQMKRVLQINPDHADALNYIGYTYAEQGIKLDEAMGMIRKALKLKPKSGYITDSLGWVYYQKGVYDKAIHYLEKAAKLTSNDPTINEHLGDAYRKIGNYRKAITSYRKALSLKHPDEKKVRQKLIDVEKLLKKRN
jgi:tetratricopeptide (TPR) repeat protein